MLEEDIDEEDIINLEYNMLVSNHSMNQSRR